MWLNGKAIDSTSWGFMAHACNPSTGEARARRSLQIWGQSKLHCDTLPVKYKRKRAQRCTTFLLHHDERQLKEERESLFCVIVPKGGGMAASSRHGVRNRKLRAYHQHREGRANWFRARPWTFKALPQWCITSSKSAPPKRPKCCCHLLRTRHLNVWDCRGHFSWNRYTVLTVSSRLLSAIVFLH